MQHLNQPGAGIRVALTEEEWAAIDYAIECALGHLHDCSHEIDDGDALYERMKNLRAEW